MAPEPQNDTKAGAATAQGARRALLIGVNKYLNFPTKQLHGCVNDVLEIRDFLVNRAGFPARQVHLLVAPLEGSPPLLPDLGNPPEPTADNIRATFGDLVQETQAGDQVLLYYSGHGVRVTNRDTGEWCYGFAPTDIGRMQGAAGFVNMVMDREINALLRTLVPRARQLRPCSTRATPQRHAGFRPCSRPQSEPGVGAANSRAMDGFPEERTARDA